MADKTKEPRTLTPVTILWQGILMLPIIGTIDSKRAQDIMETMLTKISETEAKVIILDIMGVPTVDSAVANHLLKMTRASRLMVTDCIISGISPVIAQTLVHLGVELGDVLTSSTLRYAVEFAFGRLGLEVREAKEASKKKVA